MNVPGKEPPSAAARRIRETRVLMCRPDAFDVAYAINPHMTDAEGALRRPDRDLAAAQWDALRREYEAIGYPVDVLPAVEGLPDMVFAANQTFPFVRPNGRKAVVLSRMRHAERAAEVPRYAAYFAGRGYETVALPESVGTCEGTGDLLWHPTRRLLFGGHGFRSAPAALTEVARYAEAPLIALKLVDARFYHLDTAFVPLDDHRALYVPAAFDEAGRAALAAAFPRLIAAPEDEAATLFAANAHCPDGRNVLIEERCVATRRLLAEEGFRVRPVATSEFRKAGGSVFCLKVALY